MPQAGRVGVLRRLREDLAAARSHDPAARGDAENALVYSGLHAIWSHRLAHRWWVGGEGDGRGSGMARFAARVLAQVTRFFTGIEIHPGATIGRRFFIDHGMGVVIGETAVIGDDCMLYHGVTLGGVSLAATTRHPTLGDRVVVGAGATLLGPVTIGDDSAVGAGSVVVRSAPAGSVLTGVPAVTRPARKVGGGGGAVGAVGVAAAEREFYVDPAIYI